MPILKSFLLLFPPNSLNELSFDLDNLRKIRDQAAQNRDETNRQKIQVLESINSLKGSWKTPAGKKFFTNFDTDWVTAVDNYLKTMTVFVDVLDDVIDILLKVEEKIPYDSGFSR